MSAATQDSVHVQGGAYSIAADFELFPTLAVQFERCAELLVQCAELAALAAAQQGAAAVLDPVGALEVVGQSLAGGAYAATAAVGCTELALSLRAAACSYALAEQAAQSLMPLSDAVLELPRLLSRIPAVTGQVLAGRPGSVQQLIVADPGLADLIITGLGAVDALATESLADPLGAPVLGAWGVISGTNLRGLNGQLAALYPDGKASVQEVPDGPAARKLDAPPRTVRDLLDSLTAPNAENFQAGGGQVAIRFIYSASGARSVIVDLPGTTEWNVDPRRRADQVNDLGTSLRSLADESSNYSAGVLTALRTAGVTATEPIMLVGHSQGGLVAADVARQTTASREFTVTHLVTAGSPLGAVKVPAGVSVLALENRGDVVPHLDGRNNPSRANWVTVTVDRGGDEVTSRHELSTYVQGAGDADASKDPSLSAWTAQAAPFLHGNSSQSKLFQIRPS